MRTTVDVVVENDRFIVRICEGGKQTDTPFKIEEFARSYACGQQIRVQAEDAKTEARSG
jgi:hypothetical protein